MEQPPAPFFTLEGEAFAPAAHALGPWGATISGRVMGGLVARALENAHGAEGFQPARLTVEMFRPAADSPVEVSTVAVREGRRIRVADAVVTQNGVLVARASAVFLLRSEQPPGEVWSAPWSPAEPPPMPEGMSPDHPMIMRPATDGETPDMPAVLGWNNADRKSVWIRENRALVEGEELSPFVRAAMAGDVTSPLTGWGTEGLQYINADYTMVLSRLPDGPDVGLVAADHLSADGVAVGSARLRDRLGPIGNCSITALANPAAFRMPAVPVRTPR